jgi:ATP-dependent DNA helicase RecG
VNKKGYDFILSKLQKVQAGQSFNSLGKSEIPEIVITELLVNALIHRNYFIHDSIKLFVFENRTDGEQFKVTIHRPVLN